MKLVGVAGLPGSGGCDQANATNWSNGTLSWMVLPT
jgi:hypothetical protein